MVGSVHEERVGAGSAPEFKAGMPYVLSLCIARTAIGAGFKQYNSYKKVHMLSQ